MENTTRQVIKGFFGGAKVAYATPGTVNHTANFYGDTFICELSPADVLACIECAAGWGLSPNETIEAVLSDLQLDKPED